MNENPPIRRVAVVLFDGFTVLDAYGPIQAFGACRRDNPTARACTSTTYLRLACDPGWPGAAKDPLAK